MLTMQEYGTDRTAPPILIVHGLFGSGRNWRVIARNLSESRRVVTVDLRNHGESFRADSQSYAEMADDLAQVIGGLGGEADVIGHSMGGKTSMVLALSRPALVRRLIVADIAPVAYTHGASHHELIRAMKALDLSAIETRGDADRQLAEAVDNPAIRAFLLQSFDVKHKQWRLNLDVLDRELPAILGFPDTEGIFHGPTLFLAGAQSDYIRREHRPVIKALFPNAKQAKLPGAEHWLHAEKPREFENTARMFLGG